MLPELTELAFAPNGPVQRVLGQHRPIQAGIAQEFAQFIEDHRVDNQTTVSLSEQRGGLGKTAAYAIVLLLDISLTGRRAAYATFTRALRNSIKEYEPQFIRIVRETLAVKDLPYQPINIVEFQSLTAFLSPTKCEAIRMRLDERRIPSEDIPEVQEFLRCVAETERPCEFADLYAMLPTLPCGWTELALALCPYDRDTEEWQEVQKKRTQATNDRTLILLTHAMVIRNNLRRGDLFRSDVADDGDDDNVPYDVNTLLIDEADKLPTVANTALRFTTSRNEISSLLRDIRTLDPKLRAEGERMLVTGLDQLGDAVTRVNINLTKTDPLAMRIAQIIGNINQAFAYLWPAAVDDPLIFDRIRLCRDNLRPIARLGTLNHPILRIATVRDPAGDADLNFSIELGGGRQLVSQMWRPDGGHSFQTITMASALMTSMPPFGMRYDRFRRDIDLHHAKGDRYIERPPLQPAYGGIRNVIVADRVPALLPADSEESDLLRRTSLDGLAAQITAAAHRRKSTERMVVLFQSYVAMQAVYDRLSVEMQERVVIRHRRHLNAAIADLIDRPFGIWMGVEWEGINFVHPRTRQTLVHTLIITRMPLAPRDEIRVMRLTGAFNDQTRGETIALFEAVHACYRKLYHGVLLGIRSERNVIDELWILDPRWPLPPYVYQQQPPQIIRSIGGQLFNYFERIVEQYTISGWYKVDAAGIITPILAERDAAD